MRHRIVMKLFSDPSKIEIYLLLAGFQTSHCSGAFPFWWHEFPPITSYISYRRICTRRFVINKFHYTIIDMAQGHMIWAQSFEVFLTRSLGNTQSSRFLDLFISVQTTPVAEGLKHHPFLRFILKMHSDEIREDFWGFDGVSPLLPLPKVDPYAREERPG